MGSHCAGLIVDVVRSREHEDQAELFSRLSEALDWINAHHLSQPLEPLRFATGDEIQGVFPSVVGALDASLLLRLHLLGTCELRTGVGWGEQTVLQSNHDYRGRSGSAWWHAREALELVERHSASRGWPRTLRTWVVGLIEDREAPLNALLLLRDELLARLATEDGRVVLMMLDGATQSAIAERLDITQPSVSDRIARRGLSTLVHSRELLLRSLP